MDVIIPGHHVRLLCSSLICASRIGKDLYVEFDSVIGLVLRTLNDAKSAYVCFRFQPHFFQRCAMAPNANGNTNSNANSAHPSRKRRHRNREDETAAAVDASPSPSTTNNSNNNNNTPQQESPPTTAAASPIPGRSSNTTTQSTSSSQSEKFICRVSMRALTAVVRQRKNVLSLRIRSERSSQQQKQPSQRDNLDRNDPDSDSEDARGGQEQEQTGTLCLTFEFRLQAAAVSSPSSSAGGGGAAAAPPMPTTRRRGSDSQVRVLHCIPVAELSNVSAAVATREQASEFQAHPQVLSRLLDPLKRTAEAALIVPADQSRIHASSFHQTAQQNGNTIKNRGGAVGGGGSTPFSNNNALMSNSDSLLKTETSIPCDDLYDFFFRQDREEGDTDDSTLPAHVNQHVILVFPIKEAKAFLQFAASQQNFQNQSSSLALIGAGVAEYDPVVDVFFHWGGKPIVWQVQQLRQQSAMGATTATAVTSAWKAELILATLDHHLVGSDLEPNDSSATVDETRRATITRRETATAATATETAATATVATVT